MHEFINCHPETFQTVIVEERKNRKTFIIIEPMSTKSETRNNGTLGYVASVEENIQTMILNRTENCCIPQCSISQHFRMWDIFYMNKT